MTDLRVSVALSLIAAAELVLDKLPDLFSRTKPVIVCSALISGGFCGALIGQATDRPLAATFFGCLGAILGTLLDARARANLYEITGRRNAAAVVGDSIAVGGSVIIFSLLS